MHIDTQTFQSMYNCFIYDNAELEPIQLMTGQASRGMKYNEILFYNTENAIHGKTNQRRKFQKHTV